MQPLYATRAGFDLLNKTNQKQVSTGITSILLQSYDKYDTQILTQQAHAIFVSIEYILIIILFRPHRIPKDDCSVNYIPMHL